MKTSCPIYSSPEESQIVEIEYFYESEGPCYNVVELSVLTPFSLKPSDLLADLEVGIAEDLCVLESRVYIVCEIRMANDRLVSKQMERLSIMNPTCEITKVA